MSKRYPGGIIRKTPQTPSQTSAQGIWDMASVTQAVKENTWPIAGVPDPISKSLRFRSSASAYLNRTPASTTNRQIWTWSAWFKQGSDLNSIFSTNASDNNSYNYFGFSSNSFRLYQWNGSGYDFQFITTPVYRDPSAWYHFVIQVDTTQATAANRVRFYVNGVQVTAFSTNTTPSQNLNTYVNNSSYSHLLCRNPAGSSTYCDGYLAEVNFIDGQALTPSSFGNTNDQTGVWQPIAYTGTYGTNGFYLPFSNTASTTTLGNDFSGNSNNWTVNNISLTSGSTYDSMVDVPTQWIPYNTAGDTGALFRGNYAVLNPLWKGANITPTDGNLTNPLSSGSPNAALSTMPMSTGKWYAEMTNTASYGDVGLCIVAANLTAPTFVIGSTTQTGLWEVYDNGGGIYVTSDGGAFSSSLGATRFRPAGTIQFAYDASNGYFWIGRNNTWYDSSFGTTGNPSTGANPTFTISSSRGPFNIGAGSNSATNAQYWNFGQQSFSYTPPTGFKSLCTTNLTTPTIGATASTTANEYMDATLLAANGGSYTYSGLNFQPDLVWLKDRAAAIDHYLWDSVRGASKSLSSNLTAVENTSNGGVSSFNSNGYSGSIGNTNSWASWTWKANGTGSSNTAGSITSTVSANTTAGFSIVTWTGNGTSGATVGHGLGVTPSMVILKSRSSTTNWQVKHSSLNANQNLTLNTTDAVDTAPGSGYVSAISSSTLTLLNGGSSIGNVNGSGDTYVAYCFAPVAGYSAFGSYTGNGSTDGTFVYLGFRPRWVLIKHTNQAGNNWRLVDTSRLGYNADNYPLFPSLADAESAIVVCDMLSNGIKFRSTAQGVNGSGDSYIYAAFAENPFKYSLAR